MTSVGIVASSKLNQVTIASRGSGTPATTNTTWTTVTNAVDGAVGTNPATYAVWTNTVANAVGTIDVSGYAFSSIPAAATLISVTISMRHNETQVTRVPTVTWQVMDGATTIGAAFTCTVSATDRNDSATRTPTVAQLKSGTFKVRASATRFNGTQAGNFQLDYIDVTVVYAP